MHNSDRSLFHIEVLSFDILQIIIMNTFDVLNQINNTKGQPDGTTITSANKFLDIICFFASSTMILQATVKDGIPLELLLYIAIIVGKVG